MSDVTKTMAAENAERMAKMDAGALKILMAARELQDSPDRWSHAKSGPRDDLESAGWSAVADVRNARKRAREVLWQARSLEGAIAKLEAKG